MWNFPLKIILGAVNQFREKEHIVIRTILRELKINFTIMMARGISVIGRYVQV
jgi:uncharacterized protein YlxP (DUF503 family)